MNGMPAGTIKKKYTYPSVKTGGDFLLSRGSHYSGICPEIWK
jgi:hypothetical protein